MKRNMQGGAAGLVVLVIAGAASAGPVWCETGEAGKTTGTAEVPFGAGPIGKIKGTLEGTQPLGGVPVDGDFVDVYRIYIRFPAMFSAQTVAPMAGSPFDTALWLFDHDGNGLLANDQGVGVSPFSRIGTESDDGTVTIQHPGIYYIAVSGPAHAPVSIGGQIFLFAGGFEVSGPDGVGGGSPLIDWAGNTLIGNYEINLTGVAFPPCPGDASLDGVVDVDDLNIVLGNWGGNAPPFSGGDLTGDGVVDVDDLNQVLANWASTECFDAPPPEG